jgi:hypothetical protein
MYCPNCAAQIDGVRFCRSCGANVSLVSQALNGQIAPAGDRGGDPFESCWQSLPARGQIAPAGDRGGDGQGGRSPSIEAAASSFFSGIGLFIAAFAALSFAPAGRLWWFWILIPAFGSMGHGVGKYLRYREHLRLRSGPPSLFSPQVPDTGQLPASKPAMATLPGSPIPKGSIVEQTTLNLDRVDPNGPISPISLGGIEEPVKMREKDQ